MRSQGNSSVSKPSNREVSHILYQQHRGWWWSFGLSLIVGTLINQYVPYYGLYSPMVSSMCSFSQPIIDSFQPECDGSKKDIRIIHPKFSSSNRDIYQPLSLQLQGNTRITSTYTNYLISSSYKTTPSTIWTGFHHTYSWSQRFTNWS